MALQGSSSTPLVSVLLPARDAEATIGVALASVRRQGLTNWECIVVDDGSRDRTCEAVAAVARSDPRVRLIRAGRLGIVAALNDGLSHCRGAFIARMDADDVMHRARLQAQCDVLESEPGLTAVATHVRLFPRRGLSNGLRAYEAWLNSLVSERDVRRNRFVECPVVHPTLMIRRAALQEAAYRPEPWAEDYDLVLRLLEGHARIAIVPRRLLLWRDGPARLTRTDARYRIDRFPVCKASFLARGFLRTHDSYVLWGYGSTGKTLARALAAEGRRASCIVEVHPRRIGQRIGGIPVVGLEALPSLRGQPLIASVAGARARAEIRACLAELGFVEEQDFVVAA